MTAAPAEGGVPTSERLYADFLERRRREEKFDSREIRLSGVGHCQRAESLRVLGYPGEPTTPRQEAIFAAGDRFEDEMFEVWDSRYPGQVVRQVEVVHPWGKGHLDLLVTPAKRYVECKTTTEKQRPHLPFASHVEQVQLYFHYDLWPRWGAEATAEIAYRIKETGEVLSVPVRYDPAYAEELVARLKTLQDAAAFGVPLPMPEDVSLDRFPCGWTDAGGNFVTCAFWRHCWSPEDREAADAVAASLVGRYREADDAYRTAQALADAAKAELDRVREAVSKVMGQGRTGVLFADGYELKRVTGSGWSYYDGRAAIRSGVVTKAAMEPFRRERAGTTQWFLRDLRKMAEQKGA